jgi:sec-independent protein translocase protein TatC
LFPAEERLLSLTLLEHLDELRARLIQALAGLAGAYAFAVCFASELWRLVAIPAEAAVREARIGEIIGLKPTDSFAVIYLQLPLLAAAFLASPWILWQVWAFIAPGLYARERRFAGLFVVTTAGLFVAGGAFAYFVVFRHGLVFLLTLGRENGVKQAISIVDYFDLFVNVTLGAGLAFELPVLIFFAIFLGLATPRWLLANSRYAILGIVALAAAITPTTDPFHLAVVAVPMTALYFAGIAAGWLVTR